RESDDEISRKIRTMPTDPARVRRTDPGEPEKCPVWELHKVYSDEKTKQWVQIGCRSAGIGCLECKQPVVDAVIAEVTPIRERELDYVDDPNAVKAVLMEGAGKARATAGTTLDEVRQAMGLNYQ